MRYEDDERPPNLEAGHAATQDQGGRNQGLNPSGRLVRCDFALEAAGGTSIVETH
jgi:hypothetical protein